MKVLFYTALFCISFFSVSNGRAATSASQTVKTPYGASDVEFKIHQVKDSPVYYVLGRVGIPSAENEGHTSNAGFVITQKGVVVYDSLGTAALGYRLLQAIKKITSVPVTHVIAGHYHADHIYGLQAFKQHSTAKVVAHESAEFYVNGDSSKNRLAQRRESLFPWVNDKTYIVKPDVTFLKNKKLNMGDIQIELIHAGTAHSPADIIMVVKEYGVVFSGDLIYQGRLPFLAGDDVNTRNWIAGLDYLQTLQPSPILIVPGHGLPDSNPKNSINFTKGYLTFLRNTMAAAVDKLEGFAPTYKHTNWSQYNSVRTFDSVNRGNAYRVFLELESELFE